MALPNPLELPKIVDKIQKKVMGIEKLVEQTAQKVVKATVAAAVAVAVKPVLAAVGKVQAAVAALKKWVLAQFAEVWKFVKALHRTVADLTNQVGTLTNKLNPLLVLAPHAALIVSHEPRLKKVEVDAGRSSERDLKLKGEIRELKDAIKLLKKEVDALQRK